MQDKQKILLIFGVFLLTRLIFIFTFPPFVDELNYILWGSMMLNDPSQAFSSVQIWHKQPLPFWIFGAGSYFSPNPVLGARIIALLISIPAFFVLYQLLKLFKNQKLALIGILVYSLTPLFIFFNSLALFDSILFYVGIIALWLLLRIEKNPSWLNSISLGLALGLAFWVKVTSVFLIVLSFLGLFYALKNSKSKKDKILNFSLSFIVFALISLPLLTVKDFSLVFLETTMFSYSIEEIFDFPILGWINNLVFVFLTLSIYLTPFLILSLFFLRKELKNKKVVLFFLAFFLSILSLIISSKILRTRYFLFTLAPLMPIMVLGIYNFIYISKKYISLRAYILFFSLSIGAFLLVFFPIHFFSFFIKDSVIHAERDYVFGWPSGYQLKELSNYLKENSSGNNLLLGTPITPNPVSSYLYLNAKKYPNIQLFAISFEDKKSLEGLKKSAAFTPIYFVSSNLLIPEVFKPNLTLIKSFPKPNNEDFLGIYKFEF